MGSRSEHHRAFGDGRGQEERGAGLDSRLARHLVDVAEMIIRSTALDETMTHLLQECALLTGAEGAGVLMGETGDGVREVALSDATYAAAAEVQCRIGRGPTVALLHGSGPEEYDVRDVRHRWPDWSAALAERGVEHVAAFPLRLVDEPVGGLEIYATSAGTVPVVARQVASVFAGLALVVVNHDAQLRTSSARHTELTLALESRVTVEQAKGYLCAVGGLDPRAAFDLLRTHARRSRRRVDAVAADIVSGTLDAIEVLASRRSARHQRDLEP